jgi:Arc/MetJ-type ribon-helix-helix transcriptional regulator
MTIHLPENLETPIRAAVESGRFASIDDAMAEAARLLVREINQEGPGAAPGEMNAPVVPCPTGRADVGYEQELDPQELQRRMFEAGRISEVKAPITDLAPYQKRRAVPIQGEPISETAIRERR